MAVAHCLALRCCARRACVRMASSSGGWQRQMGGAEQLGPRWHLKQIVVSGVPIVIFSGLMYKQRLDIQAEVATRNGLRAQQRAQAVKPTTISAEAAEAAGADNYSKDALHPQEDEWRVAMSQRISKLETIVSAVPATASAKRTANEVLTSREGQKSTVAAGDNDAEIGRSEPPPNSDNVQPNNEEADAAKCSVKAC